MNDKLRHYIAIKAVADGIGWPKKFTRDLTTHDQNSLSSRDPSLPFAWVLGEGGTHLMFPEKKGTLLTGKVPLRQSDLESAIGCGEPVRWFWWDGLVLIEVASWENLRERAAEYLQWERNSR